MGSSTLSGPVPPPASFAQAVDCSLFFSLQVQVLYEGSYNFSDICVPVDLFTPSLYKFDVTGKDIEDNHIMEHEHKKENYSIYR